MVTHQSILNSRRENRISLKSYVLTIDKKHNYHLLQFLLSVRNRIEIPANILDGPRQPIEDGIHHKIIFWSISKQNINYDLRTTNALIARPQSKIPTEHNEVRLFQINKFNLLTQQQQEPTSHLLDNKQMRYMLHHNRGKNE